MLTCLIAATTLRETRRLHVNVDNTTTLTYTMRRGASRAADLAPILALTQQALTGLDVPTDVAYVLAPVLSSGPVVPGVPVMTRRRQRSTHVEATSVGVRERKFRVLSFPALDSLVSAVPVLEGLDLNSPKILSYGFPLCFFLFVVCRRAATNTNENHKSVSLRSLSCSQYVRSEGKIPCCRGL
jgi:hypothetical protein